MTKLKHTPKEDLLCKMTFVKYPELLRVFAARLLRIPVDSITEFAITNPEMPPESVGDKFCRFDINMLVNGQQVDLEIQVNPQKDYAERSIFYWAKAFSTALPEGGDYDKLPKTLTISIVNFKMFECDKFYSEFGVLELTRHEMLTDKFGMTYFELPKIPETVGPIGENENERLQLWLSFFKAETEEDLTKLLELGVEEMEQAIQAFKHTSVSAEYKEMERLYSKARHDEAQFEKDTRKNEREKVELEKDIEFAKSMLADNEPIEKIMKHTKLTREQIEELK